MNSSEVENALKAHLSMARPTHEHMLTKYCYRFGQQWSYTLPNKAKRTKYDPCMASEILDVEVKHD
jgi:hypothetical protein